MMGVGAAREIFPSGCISTTRPGFALRQTELFTKSFDSHKIDWYVVNQWIRRCTTNHQETCCRPEAGLNLPGFLVIDCDTRNIVPAPKGCVYAALSYMWGPTASAALTTEFQCRLPAQAPATIEDALLCTRAIGLRYLWVNRYCIDQTDPSTKHSLIQRMDQIYCDASLTIINASG
jgi:hypothetical protein